MLNLNDDILTALSADVQLTALISSRVYYMAYGLPADVVYDLIVFETRQKPSAWADDVTTAYTCTATVHVMARGSTITIMNHVERIMRGIGFSFIDSGPGNEPDCYRDYIVFTKTEEV